MNKTALYLTLIGCLTLGGEPLLSAPKSTAERPNIIFILADDLGLDGLSCYGSDKYRTPQIDKLAASGTRFETCYAAPLCGPSRCALMTGRYAFRTGGLLNDSWAKAGDGQGAKAKNEQPMARLLKQAGYATCQTGKWRQIGDTPNDWGFDEYCTDPTGTGWYWEDSYIKNGLTVSGKHYNPDVIQEFSLDFIRRHKDGPFFLYYAMHLVHVPTLHTPISPPTDGGERYQDNIAYMDKQVGEIVAELDKLDIRNNTIVMFSSDNGTLGGTHGSDGSYTSPIHGRMINGWKGSMLEGGSRVPLIASRPGTTPVGKVSQDIVNFTDMTATFVELAGGQMPKDFVYDSRSFAPQLRGEKGNPREWAFVQLGAKWFVREPGWKLNESGELFDMSDAPFVEKPVPAGADSDASKAARARLTAVLTELNPAGGKTAGKPVGDKAGKKAKKAVKEGGSGTAAKKDRTTVNADNAPIAPTGVATADLRIRDPFVFADPATQTYYLYRQIANGHGDVLKTMRGVEVFQSKDLKTWVGPTTVFAAPEDFWSNAEVWAPEMHAYGGKFYLFVTFTASESLARPQSEATSKTNRRSTQILVGDTPTGPFRPFANRGHTPADWMSLDGTFWVEDGVPWMVFCHEWIQITDGTMELLQLAPDLFGPVGAPQRLFNASSAPWVKNLREHGFKRDGYVTDGPFLVRTKTGKLLMTWSSFGADRYAVGIAESTTGKITGPWIQQPERLIKADGGHGMIFRTFEGQLTLCFHQPNKGPLERMQLIPLEDTGDSLRVASPAP